MIRVLVAVAAATFVLATGGCADKNAPQMVSLQVTSAKSAYTTTEPVQLTARLGNSNNGACAVVPSSLFGFTVEKLTLNGQPQNPVWRSALLQNGVPGSMWASAVTLPRGRWDAPRRLLTMLAGPPELPGPNLIVGARGSLDAPTVAHWRTDQPGHYEVTVTYRPFQAAPMPDNLCRTDTTDPVVVSFDVVKTGSTVPSAAVGRSWPGGTAMTMSAAVSAFAVGVFWLLRRRRGRAMAMALLVTVAGLTVVAVQPVLAVVVYNGPAQTTLAMCKSMFEQSGGDPDRSWQFAQDPSVTVTIHDTFEPFAWTEGEPGRADVFWNPGSTAEFYHNGPRTDPCASIYHELTHALQTQHGDVSGDRCWVMRGGMWVDTDILRLEVEAVRAENRFRARHGLEPRRNYGRPPRPLPADNEQCSPASKDDPFPRSVYVDFTAAGHWGAGPLLTSTARFIGTKTAPCMPNAACTYKVPQSPEGSAEIVESDTCQGKVLAPAWSGAPVADLTFTPEAPSSGPSGPAPSSPPPTTYRLNWQFSGSVTLTMQCGGLPKTVNPPVRGTGTARHWKPGSASVTTRDTEFPDWQITATITFYY